jgi:hypothetical protein
MFRKLRSRRPSHPTVVAYLALFVALGGTGAYAAATITGADVVDESLTGADVKGRQGTSSTPAVNGTLGTQDVGGQQANPGNGTPFIDGTLTQWDIKNGSVTGDDVLESSLGKVPDADKLDGLNSTDFQKVSAGEGTLVVRTEDEGITSITGVIRHNVPCKSGERATGGGVLRVNVSGSEPVVAEVEGDQVTATGPTNGGPSAEGATPNRWFSAFRVGFSNEPHILRFYAICAKP